MKLSDFDLASQAEAGFSLVLAHPVTGEKLDGAIKVVGADSATYRNASNVIVERVRKELKALGEGEDRSTDAQDQDGAELLACATVGWDNIQDANGDQIAFTKEKAVEIYLQFDWIASQVKTAIYNRSNFFLTPKKD